jgi:formate--tetrahydrofolate ligase
MVKSDIEIAQEATMKPIIDLAGEKFGIPKEVLDPYGHFKAKAYIGYCNEPHTRRGRQDDHHCWPFRRVELH